MACRVDDDGAGVVLRQLVWSLGVLAVISPPATVNADPGDRSQDMATLPTEQVSQISGIDGLARAADDDAVSSGEESRDPCEQQFAFDTGWVGAHSVADSALSDLGGPVFPVNVIVDVVQAVVSYPDEAVARRAFDQRIEKVQQCAQLNTEPYHRAVSRPGADTAVFEADRWSEVWTLTGTTIVDVSVLGLDDSDQVARNRRGDHRGQ